MEHTIKLKDINFSYNDKNQILNVRNLEISKGEKIFIYGPSGSGKSTLLNIISGVISPQSGSVTLLNQDIKDLTVSQRDAFRGDNIGYIFQSFNLIPYLTVKENIILPLKTSKAKREKASKNLEAEVIRLLKHLALEEHIDKKASELSVGQQQRVAVARALIGSPEIIIADEPTSSLDEEVTESFIQLLLAEQEVKKFTLVFVSHDKNLSKFFDRNISLNEINN